MESLHVALVLMMSSVACLPEAHAAARVLSLLPMPMRSHWIVCRALLNALHDRGHDITVVTPYPSSGRHHNWTEVIVPDTMHLLGGTDDLFTIGQRSDYVWLLRLLNYGISSCEVLLQQKNVRDLLDTDRQFDVIIIETFFNDCFLGLAHKFKAPVIGISTLVGTVWMSDMVGSPNPLSYVPEPFLSYTGHMTFFERLNNAAFGTFARLFRRLYYLPRLDAMVRQYLNDSAVPSLSDMERNTSLLFVNSQPCLHVVRPLVPNMIEIGGMHVSPPQQLPQDLQEFLDNAQHGAILFSLGSNIRSSQMPEDKKAAFLTAFSKLKQSVLWKWEADALPGQPTNLKLAKWLPQSDILAHKNLKLFITHGGLGSTIEAVYHGVPLIGLPVFADQDANMIRAEQHGYALKLDFSNITAETLLWAITEILTNPRYNEKAQQLSGLFHDRPMSPIDEAVYWTEYVIRHHGAPHMRSAALDLSWYQLLLLDVAAVVLGGAAMTLLFLIAVVRKIISTCSDTAPKATATNGILRTSKKQQ